MKVKVCGITNLEDALQATEAGADFLGFIFYPASKRFVDVATAAAIVPVLRSRPACPLLVGVFVDEAPGRAAEILDECQLDLAQLSGSEVPSLLGEESSPLFGRAYKVLRPASAAEAEADVEWFVPTQMKPGQPSLLLDTYDAKLYGGTGRTGDWDLARRLARRQPGVMLAGGLTPENVGEAVRTVAPFAVDVASGVEEYPGKKDPAKVLAFIVQAKAA